LDPSLWFLWTFPLAFLLTDSKGAIVLALGRELLWAVSLSIGIIGLRGNRSGIGKAVLGTVCSVGFFIGSIVFATIPDWSSLSNLKMDNIGTGRICKGIPQLPATRVDSADWLVSGSPKLVSSERLSLGDRQRILAGFDGQILVRVATGPTPAPEDTSGSTATSSTDGPILESMISSLPISVPDNSRLLALHGMVHKSIRYDRSYFPGTTEQILTRRTGDCKAYAQVFCAGARRLGYPARVVHGLLASHDGLLRPRLGHGQEQRRLAGLGPHLVGAIPRCALPPIHHSQGSIGRLRRRTRDLRSRLDRSAARRRAKYLLSREQQQEQTHLAGV
jgi:hypothetical protein